jgi:ribonucleoside-diphosphate reductase alpha chain
MKAFLQVHGTQGAASASVRETVDGLTEMVVRGLLRSRPGGGTFHIEDVQDQVELGLMRGGHHEVARAYVLYRERRAQERAKQGIVAAKAAEATLTVTDGGQRVPLDLRRLQTLIESACEGLGADVKPDPILGETKRNLYDGVPIDEVYKAAILAARTLIEKEPGVHARHGAAAAAHDPREILGEEVSAGRDATATPSTSPLHQAGRQGRAARREAAAVRPGQARRALEAERDLQFDYLGLQTLYDRYFLHVRRRRIELPQAFFMRVAMGLR